LLLFGLVLLAVAAVAWMLATDGPATPSPELDVAPLPEDASPEVSPRGVDGPGARLPLDRPDPEGRVPAARARAGLTGAVVDARGRGLRGARVRVVPVEPASLRGAPYADGAPLAATRTDRSGDFALEAVATGRWLRVLASLEGYATVGRLVSSAGAHLTLVLPPAGGLTLTLVDTEDKPVAEAEVHAGAGETRLTTTSNARGVARFEALPPGAVQVRILAPAHGGARAGPYTVRAGAMAEHVVVMARAVVLEGTVLDEDTGRPIDDAQVRVARPGQAAEAATNAQGRFGPLPGGGVGERVFLATAAEGYAPILEPVHLRMAGTQTVVLHLRKAPPWEGRVLDAQGRPLAGATVRYSSDGVAIAPRGTTTTTDELGRFTLPPPPVPAPGRRVVLLAEAGDALGALALRPDQLPPTPLDLVVERGASVTGRVVDAQGAGLAGVGIRLTPAWSKLPRQARTDAIVSRLHAFNAVGNQGLATASGAEGYWRLDGVPAGPFVLRYRQGGHEFPEPEPLLVGVMGADAGSKVLGDGITLTGEVVDARGQGVPGVIVTSKSPEGPSPRRRASTDADGRFELPGLSPGPHEVRALLAGRTGHGGFVSVAPEGDNHLRMVLDEPAVLALQVTKDGAPYKGLLTVAFGETGSGRAAARRHTLRVRGGKAVLDDAPPGEWTVEAYAPGGLRAQVQEVQVDSGRRGDVRIALTAGARLTGTVRSAGGRSVASAQLELEHPATGGRVKATADGSGRYHLEGLAPGDWTLQVLGRGGAPLREQLVLAAGEARTLDPTLPAAGRVRVRVVTVSGSPIPEARVAFRAGAGPMIRTRRPARTDRQGQLVQADLPPGLAVVTVRDNDGRQGLQSVRIVAGEQAEAVVVLARPAR
ncbi:MAG: carboxypeptidase regulatory-like domain-containing protein, partial [Planctomycetota bacterium]|nr:carboxypeptidase regulatory-like domain-containing protein [Planctomycetota bacterium]